jgi:hypothetical protein
VAGLETSAELLPPLRVLAAYGLFFAFGWMLFRNRDLLPSFRSHWTSTLVAGGITAGAYLYVAIAQPLATVRSFHITEITLAGFSIWMLIYGTTGFFLRYLDTPKPIVRYFSDASYWIYLVHVLPIVWLNGLLARSGASAATKFGIVVGTTALLATLSYHYFVRSTRVGEMLNGRRPTSFSCR